MPSVHYCWRCGIDVPMLDEAEWAQVHRLLTDTIQNIQQYRRATGASLLDAKSQDWGRAARDKFLELTGFVETNENAVWHHRMSLFGPPCVHCGKLLRTKSARVCAECWRRV
jgi:hypothetical protein